MTYSILSYSKDGFKEHKDASIADSLRIKDSVIWLDLTDPSEKEIKELEKSYDFHHLSIDDCMHEVQRPKIEVYDKHFFVVLRHAVYEERIKTRQLSIFVGENYLVSVHKEKLEFLDRIVESIKEGGHRMNIYGPDYLLYKITDSIVDNYFEVLGGVEEVIEEIEENVMKKPSKATLRNIFKAKKDLLNMRKRIWHLREVLHTIQSGTVCFVSETSTIYFRDVYDHVINVIDLIETYRELLTTALETYLSSVSNSLNEVIKILTVISAIIMLPTLIASVYGMNFRNMPELGWVYGYPFALGLIILSMVLTYLYFRNKNWI